MPFYRWFVSGEVNTCYNAFDRHVAGGRAADQPALIYDSPVTRAMQRYTYRELLEAVARFAGVLVKQGVEKDDRILLHMPMIPEAVIAMLACARFSAIHSVVFGGFAAHELSTRIDDAQPKLIVLASYGIEPNRIVSYKSLLDQAIARAQFKPQTCIIFQRPQEKAALVAGHRLSTGAMEEAKRVVHV